MLISLLVPITPFSSAVIADSMRAYRARLPRPLVNPRSDKCARSALRFWCGTLLVDREHPKGVVLPQFGRDVRI